MSNKLRRKAQRKSRPAGRSTPSAGSPHVTEIRNPQQFHRDVLAADVPVIVDFWAPWCQPCKMMAPVFAKVAGRFVDQVKFVKVDTEANQALARDYNISSIPSLLIFSGGEVIDARMGLTPEGALETMTRRALDKHRGVGLVGKVKRMFGGSEPAVENA